MDLVLEKKQTPIKLKILISAVIILMSLSIWAMTRTVGNFKVNTADLEISEVSLKSIRIDVAGYGVIKSRNQRIVTSQVSGTVVSLYKRPGDKVVNSDVILVIDSPSLDQDVSSLKLDIAKQKSEQSVMELESNLMLLERQAKISEMSTNYEKELYKLHAEEKLVESGIVSKLNYINTKLNVESISKRIEIEEAVLVQAQEINKKNLSLKNRYFGELNNQLVILEKRKENLNVVPMMGGELLELKVELGESVDQGQQLAVIGSTKNLIAELRVPQNKADALKVGDVAHIDLRPGQLKGSVTRIEKMVVDGTVLVEVALEEDISGRARPALSIEGTITVDTVDRALVLKRANGIEENSKVELFKVASSGETARKVEVTTGLGSEFEVVLTSGAQEGDLFVLPTGNDFNDKEEIHLHNN
ncbi:efflux RND transporter periplasmic adaptor subunit [Pseudoalteromonas rhizosphaerae]|uniref:efflux RND transporter periplasmic adaptor subunit n=1 Tax=Pseudoalteromonas rhizosphaerae TaxID=2518973 RepID=UPI003850A7E0